MNKIVKKIIKITLIFLLFINGLGIYNNVCYAQDAMTDVSENIDYWKPLDIYGTGGFRAKVSDIASIIRVIGILVSLGTLMVIGIKFMISSVEEKAQYKQKMMPWLIGAVMVFAMSTIPALIFNVSKELF